MAAGRCSGSHVVRQQHCKGATFADAMLLAFSPVELAREHLLLKASPACKAACVTGYSMAPGVRPDKHETKMN